MTAVCLHYIITEPGVNIPNVLFWNAYEKTQALDIELLSHCFYSK